MARLLFQWRLILLGAIIAASFGCVREGSIDATYEERYRLFFLKDQFSPVQLTRDPDVAAKSFIPMASLNRSFEELANEGFTLTRIKPVGDEGGATKFVFRRRIPEGYHPTSAPMEFSGLYRVQAENAAAPVYYILDPRPNGYTLRIVQASGEETIAAKWDGRQLHWREGVREHSLILSGDGRSVIHNITEVRIPEPDRPIETETLEAIRVTETKNS